MKNLQKLVVIMVLLSVSILVNANAVDWLDYNDPTLWDGSDASKSNIGWNPDGSIPGRYNAYSDGASNDQAGIYSKWGFDASQDFSVQVNYGFDNSATTGNAGIVMFFAPLNNSTGIQQGVGRLGATPQYYWNDPIAGNEGGNLRTNSLGILNASYNATSYMVTLSYPEGFTKSINVGAPGSGDLIGMGFEVLSDNALITEGDAFFENIQINSGIQVLPAVAPEPISATLFLLGGAGLVAYRRRKKQL